MLLQGKVAIITGAASARGIGRATAATFARHGAHVVILDLDEAAARDAAASLGEGHLGLAANVADQAQVNKAIAQVIERYGRIDVLVNSAGHGPKGDILEISDDDWHLGMDVYLMNVIRPSRLVAPVMAGQGGGTILNISTFAVFEPDPMFPTSGVFRAGLAGFTKLFADAYAGDNIRINNVLPGFIDSLPEKDDRRERIPMGRYGRAEEVAGLVSYLASDAAAYVTGQNIRIDGGH